MIFSAKDGPTMRSWSRETASSPRGRSTAPGWLLHGKLDGVLSRQLSAVVLGVAAIALSACGGGSAPATSANVQQASLPQSVAVTLAAPLAAEYTVVNLGSGGWVPAKGINSTGQVAFRAYDSATGRHGVVFYDGTATQTLDLGNSTHSEARGINDSGQIAGSRLDPSLGWNAFSWSPTGPTTGVTTSLSTPGTYSYANGINNSRQVAGYSWSKDDQPRASTWSPTGAMTDLGTLGGSFSYALGINNSGQVTGYSYTTNNTSYRAFFWSGSGAMTDLGTLGGGYSEAQLINDVGQVAGHSHTSNFNLHPFVWSPTTGVMTDLGTLGGTHAQATAINNSGQVAGFSYTTNNTSHRAFFWNGTGAMTDLGTLGGTSSYAYGMNNSGQVVGYAYTSGNSNLSAFAWTATDGMVDLNTRIPKAPAGLHLYYALAISDNGSIVAQGNTGLVLLKPGVTSLAAPALGPITANDPVAVGSPVTVSASFTDTDSADTHTATWAWGDASTSPIGAVTQTSPVAGSHTYTAAGVYQVTLQVTDNTGKTAQVSRDVVVYDPSAGFVTGGGWIMSPPGAYKQELTLGGRATFGFVSKYLKGATKPSGKTEFQFHAANLNFHSEDYEWLVVAGARAQYKGSGTINGSGDYKFLLTAVDGSVRGGGGTDRFRIKIWHYDADAKADVVDYDNQLDTSTEGTTNEGTVIGGGSIVIHSK